MGIIRDAALWWLGHVGAATIDTEIVTPVNTAINNLGSGYIGSSTTGANVTLATASVLYASTASFTWTVPTGGRRYRIHVGANYAMAAGTNGLYQIWAAYNTGAAPVIGSATRPGQVRAETIAAAGSGSQLNEADVFLAAGQTTVYAAVQRGSGGSGTDVAGAFYVAVYDVAAV